MLFAAYMASVIKYCTCLIDIQHPCAVHNVNIAPQELSKGHSNNFSCFECFVLLKRSLRGKSQIFSNVLHEYCGLLPVVKPTSLPESLKYGVVQLKKNKF